MWNVWTQVLLVILALMLSAMIAPRLSIWQQSESHAVRGLATVGVVGVIVLSGGSIALSFMILLVLGS